MTIIRIEHNRDYTCISNNTLRDKRLSYKARGLHHLLLSYPNNWTLNIDHLVAESDHDGRAAVMSALNELQAHGYMTMRRVRDKKTGKFNGWEKVIRETPIPQDEAISTEVQKSNVGKKTRKSNTTAEVRKSNVGNTEVRKTALRKSHQTDKPHDGKPDCIISTDLNKYLLQEISNQQVSNSPLTPQGEQGCVEQLEISFTSSTAAGDRSFDESPRLEKLPGKEVSPDLPDVPPQPNLVENVADTVGSNSPFSLPPEPLQLEQQLPPATPPEVTRPLVEVVDSEKAIADQEQPFQQHPRNRFRRHQQHSPRNIDGSDRLPWETQYRGKFDPEFEKWMARSLMQYPAFQNLMAGELVIKIRKHISAGKYDFKRQDELFIEWEAMHSSADMGDQSYGITAKAVSRRAKIRSALCS